MEKILTALEDLWISVTFAEAGAYEFLRDDTARPVMRETVRVRS